MILVSLDRGMFVDVRSTLSLQCWLKPSQNDKVGKNGTI